MDKIDLKRAESILDALASKCRDNVKRIKSEKGLIERIESDKIVLTEDNKMLLKD
jgi:hypothetical protein